MKTPDRKDEKSCNSQILDQLHETLAGTQAMYFKVAEHLGFNPVLRQAMEQLAEAHTKPLAILEGKAKPLIIPHN